MSPAVVLRRSSALLFAALALAMACGLGSLPPVDPLRSLRELAGAPALLAAALHLGLAALGAEASRRALARQGVALCEGEAARWGVAVTSVMAWLWWVGQWQLGEVADARALLWLEMLPLWLWPAGLLQAPSAQAAAHRVEHFGAAEQIDMPGARHLEPVRPRPRLGRLGEHDVVAAAEHRQPQPL